MSEVKHTPEPWVLESGDEAWYIKADRDIIAVIPRATDAKYGEVVGANARLMTVAPSLLAAAEGVLDAAMLSDWHLGNDGEWLPDCKALRDAIHQARETA